MQIKVYGEQWLSTAACGFEPDDDKWEILRKKLTRSSTWREFGTSALNDGKIYRIRNSVPFFFLFCAYCLENNNGCVSVLQGNGTQCLSARMNKANAKERKTQWTSLYIIICINTEHHDTRQKRELVYM